MSKYRKSLEPVHFADWQRTAGPDVPYFRPDLYARPVQFKRRPGEPTGVTLESIPVVRVGVPKGYDGRLGPGQAAAQPGVVVLADDQGRRYRVVVVSTGGRLRVSEVGVLAAEDESLSATRLQGLGLGEVILAALAELTVTGDDLPPSASHLETLAGRRKRGRPRVTSDAEYQLAADAYRAAQAQGRPTTAAVMDALNCSESTALKRVWAARKRELLPPANGTTRPKL